MRRIIATVGLVALVTAALARSPRDYTGWSKDGLIFKDKILLEVGESGPDAGRERWTISETGEWTYTPKGQKVPTRKGTLTDDLRKAIAVHLSAAKFNDLPRSVGLPPDELVADETRHFMALKVGTKRTVIVGKTKDFTDAVDLGPKEEKGSKDKPKEDRRKEPDRAADRAFAATARETSEQENWSRFIGLATSIKVMMEERRFEGKK